MIENASLLAGAVIKRAILDYKCRLRCYKTLDEYRESSSLELKSWKPSSGRLGATFFANFAATKAARASCCNAKRKP